MNLLIRNEKNGLALDTFLLALGKQGRKSKQTDRFRYPLPDAWQKIIGNKSVVCFCLGRKSIHEAMMRDESYLTTRIDFLRQCFSNLRDIVLWWFDDGLFMHMVKECKAETEQSLLENFKKEIKMFQQDGLAIYDASGKWERVLAWSDAYYGDTSTLTEAFSRADKLIGFLDITCLDEGRPANSLTDWMKSIWYKPGDNGKSFSRQMHKQGKRVVLAYASTAAALSQGKAFFDGWNAFLSTCREQELAVWWHCDGSLSELAECMTPDVRNSFIEFKHQVENSPYVFPNEAGYLEGALEFCDAYYGNYAAVAAQNAMQGMPVVWHNHGRGWVNKCHVGTAKGMLMSFITGCWVEDEYYFTHWRANGLFKTGCGRSDAYFVSKLPVHSNERNFLSANIFFADGALYFIPTNATEILTFDLAAEKWDSYCLDSQYARKPHVWFAGAFKVGDSLWLKPVNYAAMVKFDLDTRNISYFSGWGKQVWDSAPDASDQYWGEAALVGENVWIAAKQSGYIMKFSTVSQMAEMHKVPEAASGFRSLAYDGKDFWLYTFSDVLLRWNPRKGIVGCWDKPLGECKGGAIICKAGKAWLFAHLDDRYVRIDTQSECLSYCAHYLSEELRSGLGYAQLSQDDENIYIHPNTGELIVCINSKTEAICTSSLRMVKADEERYALANFQDIKKPVGGGAFYDIYELVMYLRLGNIYHGAIEKEKDKSFGQAVYEEVVRLCN